VGKKLRSNRDILRWVLEHPNSPIDLNYVNMLVPISEKGDCDNPKAIKSLTEKVIQSLKQRVEAVTYGVVSLTPTRKESTAGANDEKVKTKKIRKLKSNPDSDGEEWYNLPGGWIKYVVFRQSRHATYLTIPAGKKLRSNNDILRWVGEHPNVPIDLNYVNMLVPINELGVCHNPRAIQSLRDRVEAVRNGAMYL